MDWPVLTADAFLWLSCTGLVLTPLVAACDAWRRRVVQLAAIGIWSSSLIALALSWRDVAGGFRAALFGHLALVCGGAMLAATGRVVSTLTRDRLIAALLGLSIGLTVVVGIFAVGPALSGPATPARWLLFANPLVTVASAAGIDLLHLDAIYRTSPLAHRGIALPSWTTACLVYLITGIAVHAARRVRPWSH